MPQATLQRLLRSIQAPASSAAAVQGSPAVVGIGLDSCAIPVANGRLLLVQTTDFFYPIVDDPYMMGRIACANTLSDLYAMGVECCDNMLLLLSVSNKMTDRERDVVTPLLMKGFQDAALEAGSRVEGGQTVINPWVIVGGVATSVCAPGDVILPSGAQPGDAIVLTKPLGTQLFVNLLHWYRDGDERYERVKHLVDGDQMLAMEQFVTQSMARLNRTAARLMHTHGAHCATDITGFGILGHAENLAAAQSQEVTFVIDTLPVLRNMVAVAELVGFSRLLKGLCPETSGGLFVALAPQAAVEFCQDIERIDGQPAWIVGRVEAGPRGAKIVDNVRIVEAP